MVSGVRPTLILILLASSAHAFELRKDRSGETVRWPATVSFVVDRKLDAKLGASGAMQAVQGAVSTWAGAGTQLTVEPGEVDGVKFDGKNQIVVIDDDWPYDADVMAVTVVTVDVTNHRIIDADIAINAAQNQFQVLAPDSKRGGNQVDVQNTLTHELGHALGLQHDMGHPESVMFPMAYAGDVDKRALSADDLAALDALYPLRGMGCSLAGGSPFLLLLALSVAR